MINDVQLARKNKRHFWILVILAMPLDLIALLLPSFFVYAVCLFAIQQFNWDVNLYLVFLGDYILVLLLSLLIVRVKTKMPIEKILNRNHAYVIKKDSHYQELIDTVSSLVLSLDLPMPELYLIPTDHEQPDHPKANLIAIKEKNRFSIMLTDSMLKFFDRYELESLLAIQLELVHSHYLTNYQTLHLFYYPISQILSASGWFGQAIAVVFDTVSNAQLEDNLAKANQWALKITYNPDILVSALNKLKTVSVASPQQDVEYGGNSFYAKSWLVPLLAVGIDTQKLTSEQEYRLASEYFHARIGFQLEWIKEQLK